jgi:diguanylate cyclase (GGDEF)-like protein
LGSARGLASASGARYALRAALAMTPQPLDNKKLAPLITALLIASVATTTLPLAAQNWSVAPWFVAVFQASIFWLDGATAVVLWTQVYATRRQVELLWLAAAYAYAATIALIQLFTYPEILNADMLGGMQTSAWLWVAWHSGFPLFVIVGALAWQHGAARPERLPHPIYDLAFKLVLGPALAVALATIFVVYADELPVIIIGGGAGHFQAHLVRYVAVATTVAALISVALGTRLRTRLQLWLAVSLFALIFEELLAIAGGGRFSAGWYIGRCLSFVSSSALMVSMVTRYVRLLRATTERASNSEEEARRDPLTGLYNRRYLFERLAREADRARRHGDDLAILLIDVDHFKQVNDTYGHAQGDLCLKALASILTRRLRRDSDVVARYGGEEFVVILPGTKLPAAKKLAEELRAAVAQAFDRNASPLPLSVCIGIGVGSGHSGDLISVERLLAQADECLYAAKEGGRDRVVAPVTMSLVSAA